MKVIVPEIDHARHRDHTQRNPGASDDPPSQQGHPAHDKSRELFVAPGSEDEDEVILPLETHFSRESSSQSDVFSLTPEEGNAEATSESPRVMVHCTAVATRSPKTTLCGPPYTRFCPKQLRYPTHELVILQEPVSMYLI